MNIVVHSMTDNHIIKVLNHIIRETTDNKLDWTIISINCDDNKGRVIKKYYTNIIPTYLRVDVTIDKYETSVDTMKDIKVKLVISYDNYRAETNKYINLIYNTCFYNTDKIQYKSDIVTVDSLLGQLVEIFDYLRFDIEEENIIRNYIDDVII